MVYGFKFHKQFPLELGFIGELALPYDDHQPTEPTKSREVQPVPLDIARELRDPEIDVRLGQKSPPTALVMMPKAAIDKHHSVAGWHHDIGLPW